MRSGFDEGAQEGFKLSHGARVSIVSVIFGQTVEDYLVGRGELMEVMSEGVGIDLVVRFGEGINRDFQLGKIFG